MNGCGSLRFTNAQRRLSFSSSLMLLHWSNAKMILSERFFLILQEYIRCFGQKFYSSRFSSSSWLKFFFFISFLTLLHILLGKGEESLIGFVSDPNHLAFLLKSNQSFDFDGLMNQWFRNNKNNVEERKSLEDIKLIGLDWNHWILLRSKSNLFGFEFTKLNWCTRNPLEARSFIRKASIWKDLEMDSILALRFSFFHSRLCMNGSSDEKLLWYFLCE